jgi:hypothetical protein
MERFYFRSSKATDGMTGCMMISCKNLTKAREYAKTKFKEYGYKGRAVRVAALTFVMLVCCIINTNAATKADTLRVDNKSISEVIVYPTTNSKGEKTTKYYFIYKGELVNTSKTVVEKYKLAKQFHANCALAIVVSKSNKRIILN